MAAVDWDEYFTVYGWAYIVIIVLLCALFFLNYENKNLKDLSQNGIFVSDQISYDFDDCVREQIVWHPEDCNGYKIHRGGSWSCVGGVAEANAIEYCQEVIVE